MIIKVIFVCFVFHDYQFYCN